MVEGPTPSGRPLPPPSWPAPAPPSPGRRAPGIRARWRSRSRAARVGIVATTAVLGIGALAAASPGTGERASTATSAALRATATSAAPGATATGDSASGPTGPSTSSATPVPGDGSTPTSTADGTTTLPATTGPSTAPAGSVAPTTTAVLSGVATSAPTVPPAAPTPTVPPTTVSPPDWLDAATVLAGIPVAREQGAGYRREVFAYGADLDRDGCDTRAEVLMRDSRTPPQVDPFGCKVVAGDWYSPYDGVLWSDAAEVEIDHVVALKEAWDSGAHAWSAAALRAFANDVTDGRTLVVATGAVNTAKGDRDPSNWMPPLRSDWCRYVGDWLAIKARWSMSMDESEAGRIRNLLKGECAGLRVAPWAPPPVALTTSAVPAPEATAPAATAPPATTPAAPAPAPDPAPAPVVPVPETPAPTQPAVVAPAPIMGAPATTVPTITVPADVYYANCTEARAAGAAPILLGQPGYRPRLDGDGDGVACE